MEKEIEYVEKERIYVEKNIWYIEKQMRKGRKGAGLVAMKMMIVDFFFNLAAHL